MRRRPPRSTRTDTLFPYTTLFRAPGRPAAAGLARLPHRAAPRDLPDQYSAGQSRRTIFRAASDHRPARNGAPDPDPRRPGHAAALAPFGPRSEERRVGKECVRSVDLGGSPIIKKKTTITTNR